MLANDFFRPTDLASVDGMSCPLRLSSHFFFQRLLDYSQFRY
jgi:hypothetical protein